MRNPIGESSQTAKINRRYQEVHFRTKKLPGISTREHFLDFQRSTRSCRAVGLLGKARPRPPDPPVRRRARRRAAARREALRMRHPSLTDRRAARLSSGPWARGPVRARAAPHRTARQANREKGTPPAAAAAPAGARCPPPRTGGRSRGRAAPIPPPARGSRQQPPAAASAAQAGGRAAAGILFLPPPSRSLARSLPPSLPAGPRRSPRARPGGSGGAAAPPAPRPPRRGPGLSAFPRLSVPPLARCYGRAGAEGRRRAGRAAGG